MAHRSINVTNCAKLDRNKRACDNEAAIAVTVDVADVCDIYDMIFVICNRVDTRWH